MGRTFDGSVFYQTAGDLKRGICGTSVAAVYEGWDMGSPDMVYSDV